MNQEQIKKYNDLIKSIIKLQKKPDVKNLKHEQPKLKYTIKLLYFVKVIKV